MLVAKINVNMKRLQESCFCPLYIYIHILCHLVSDGGQCTRLEGMGPVPNL